MTGPPIHTKDAIKLALFILINKSFPPGPRNTVNNYLFKGRITIGPLAASEVDSVKARQLTLLEGG